MIATALIYLLGLMLGVITSILPEFQLWPDQVFNAFDYVVRVLLNIDILHLMPTVIDIWSFELHFLIYFIIFLLARRVFNWMRGAGPI